MSQHQTWLRRHVALRQPPWARGLRYRIAGQLGQGAHGTVWLGRRRRRRDLVAIKRFDSGRADSEAFMRFVQEQRMRLEHPHIVSTRAWVHDAHRSLLIMDYVHGPDLQQVLDANLVVPAETLIDWARQLLDGVGHIHELGIIHRDIKPSNVLVDVENARPVLKLADFGSALLLDGPRLTVTGGQVGTYPFVAPEVLTSGESDEASDFYAVGVTLRELSARCDGEAASVDRLVASLVAHNPMDRPRSASIARLTLPDVDPAGDRDLRDQLDRLAGPHPRPPVVGVGTIATLVVLLLLGVFFVNRKVDDNAYHDLVARPLGTVQLASSAATGGTARIPLGEALGGGALGEATVVQCRIDPPWSGPDHCDRATAQPLASGPSPRAGVLRRIVTPGGSVDCAATSCGLVIASDRRRDLIWTQLDFGS